MSEVTEIQDAEVSIVPLDLIERNPAQPRETFPQEHIEGLAASIKKRGLIQPITVKPIGQTGRYMIVAGECRYRAHQLLNAGTIRCIIESIDDDEMRLRAIVENLQRRDMNPIEEAKAYKSLVDAGYTFGQIVEELGLKSQSIVRQRLELLGLSDEAQHLVARGQIGVSMASGIAYAPQQFHSQMLRDIASGKLRTSEQVRIAGMAYRDAADQTDIFGSAPKASAKDIKVMNKLEAKVDSIVSMVQAGFKDGECTAARNVSPDRVATLTEKLALIRKSILVMEYELSKANAQGQMLLG